MASLRARFARFVARVSTKGPVARAIGKPGFVPRYRATLDRMTWSFAKPPRGVERRRVDDAGVRGEWLVAAAHSDARRVVLYLHGGGYVACSPAHYRTLTGALAKACDARVFALDYRLAPEHPYPAALEDALCAYDWLLAQGVAARDIAVGGDSAGGGLALSLLLALRDRGGPMPAAGVLLSPWLDLSSSGDSVRANAALDDVVVYDGSRGFAQLYAGDIPLDDPRVSGLFADLRGLPPLLVQASEIEMLRDDSVRLRDRAAAAGTDVRLHLYDGVHHVWQLFEYLPETRAALAEIGAFVKSETGR